MNLREFTHLLFAFALTYLIEQFCVFWKRQNSSKSSGISHSTRGFGSVWDGFVWHRIWERLGSHLKLFRFIVCKLGQLLSPPEMCLRLSQAKFVCVEGGGWGSL